jgi:hypothetical protein
MSRSNQPLRAPEKLRADHNLSGFECGEPSLDDWLRRRALQNEKSGASRTYLVCAGQQVVGYHALAVGAVARSHAPGRVRRNMPDPGIRTRTAAARLERRATVRRRSKIWVYRISAP